MKFTKEQINIVKEEFKKYLNKDISDEHAEEFFSYLVRLAMAIQNLKRSSE